MVTLSDIAKQYIGKTETPNNSGFNDKIFQKKMEQVGWLKGQAWCSYFAELCLLEWAITNNRKDLLPIIKQICSGSSTATFKNADLFATQNPNGPIKISKKPIPNAIAIYRYGQSWKGHTAITTNQITLNPPTTTNIEGNTNDKGGREGYIVAKKTRVTPKIPSNSQLNIVGYIQFI